MQAPYLAITWPAADVDGGAQAATRAATACREAGWRLTVDRPGLQLWIRPERPAPAAWSAEAGGLLIGRWHAGGDGASRPAVGGGTLARAQQLCGGGWGSYVALLQEREGGWRAFRDPSGTVDALTWTVGPLGLLAGSLADVPAGLLPADIGLDWEVLAGHILQPAAEIVATPLRGVHAVPPGALRTLAGPSIRQDQIWRPTAWLPASPERDPAWPARLRARTEEVTAALAAPYAVLVSEASGGLDSSIVNAALARAGQSGRLAAALHYVGDRREADERAWAQALAERYDLPLLCAERTRDAAFDPVADYQDLSRDARPPLAALDAVRDRDTAQRLRALGADALLTGKGGDGLFFQMPSVRVLSDLWAAQGPRALTHPRGREVAQWLRRSWWSVWREALRLPPPGGFPLARFAGRAVRDAPEAARHPWLDDLAEVAPGKRLQIRGLVGGQASVGATRRTQAVDVIQPLLSQPLLELALSIPSWELVRGGRDRGLAREAFASWLPATVAQRRSKGALTSIYARRAAAGAAALREHLVEGSLTRAGLLDRDAVEAALTPDALMRRNDGPDLLTAAALETWVRHWQTRVPDAAGARRQG